MNWKNEYWRKYIANKIDYADRRHEEQIVRISKRKETIKKLFNL